MGIKDRIKKEAQKRILKSKVQDKLSEVVSDEKARRITDKLLSVSEDSGEQEDETGDKQDQEESDTWLDKKAREAEEYMEEDGGPVKSIDDMDELIEEKKRESDEEEDKA